MSEIPAFLAVLANREVLKTLASNSVLLGLGIV